MILFDNIREIPLTQGKVALVDSENYEWLKKITWFAHLDAKNNNWYAGTNIKTGPKKYKTIKMHRIIMGVADGKICVDHKNRNGLHNYKSNLRLCTKAQNAANRRSHLNSSSRYLGVCWVSQENKWRADICKAKKMKYLGSFKNEEDAAIAYDKAAKEIHGEFANLNFK